jgi:NAD(P)-dependent dehydrogenase (short-subunit alcohol dehydrogenase family)
MAKEKRIALVTGANKGIGFEVARDLARKGFHVFLGARDTEAGEAAAEKLRKVGEEEDYGEITVLKIDVSKPDSIRRAAEEFSRKSDRLDTLVNNAGILLDDDKDVLMVAPETFETTLRTNTLGPLLVAQAFVPFLKKSDAPRIVNVSSGGGQLADGADGWAPAYCISKTALNGVTAQLPRLPKFASIPSVRAGSRPTWAAPMPPVRLGKEPRASSGSRWTLRKTKPVSSGAIAKSFHGERDSCPKHRRAHFVTQLIG